MVKEDEKVSVHSWSMADQKWTKIGDVVGAAGGSEVSLNDFTLHNLSRSYRYPFYNFIKYYPYCMASFSGRLI